MIVGIGVDIVQLSRIRALCERHDERFLGRILTEREQEYCRRRVDPVPSVASRFAAKEALLKALGVGWSGGVRWRDVEVVRGESGPPSIELHGEAARVAAKKAVRFTHVSLSHDSGAAVAVVVLESGP